MISHNVTFPSLVTGTSRFSVRLHEVHVVFVPYNVVKSLPQERVRRGRRSIPEQLIGNSGGVYAVSRH